MKDFINKENIILDLETEDKNTVIKKMADTVSDDVVIDREKFIEDILKREEIENTVVGFKVAVPHGKSDYIKYPKIVFVRLKNEIFWGDNEENVKYVFLLGIPLFSANEHINILMKLSKKILDERFRESIGKSDNKDEILKLILE